MQHEVTNGRDPICNMKLPMVGTLYVTRDPICNETLPRPLVKLAYELIEVLVVCAAERQWLTGRSAF